MSGGKLGWHPPGEEERVTWLRDTRTFEIPEAGHMMHWTRPEALARAIAEVTAGLRAPSVG